MPVFGVPWIGHRLADRSSRAYIGPKGQGRLWKGAGSSLFMVICNLSNKLCISWGPSAYLVFRGFLVHCDTMQKFKLKAYHLSRNTWLDNKNWGEYIAFGVSWNIGLGWHTQIRCWHPANVLLREEMSWVHSEGHIKAGKFTFIDV